MPPDESLRSLQQLVMLAVLQLDEDAYGAIIQQELESRSGRSVTIATIYVTLSRLQRRGLIESWMGDPTPTRGGRAKRFYRVTEAGLDALEEARTEMELMWAGVSRRKERTT
jgi:PadR family transcriptional regulator PadR